MDRFIETCPGVMLLGYWYLKSNMDRFIDKDRLKQREREMI